MAVAWRGRSPAAVVADMVDGVVLVNGLAGREAAACRLLLWSGLAAEGLAAPEGQAAVAEVIAFVPRPAVVARAAAG